MSYNRNVLVLMQEIENFEGILILTTNRVDILDNALDRRIAFKIEFDLPGIAEREKIWQVLVPDKVVIDTGVDFSVLAKRFPFAGGNIKNAVFWAIMKAGERSPTSPILKMEDLLSAGEREYSKMNKNSKSRIGF